MAMSIVHYPSTGAVMCGCSPELISARRSRLSYGVRTSVPYIEGAPGTWVNNISTYWFIQNVPGMMIVCSHCHPMASLLLLLLVEFDVFYQQKVQGQWRQTRHTGYYLDLGFIMWAWCLNWALWTNIIYLLYASPCSRCTKVWNTHTLREHTCTYCTAHMQFALALSSCVKLRASSIALGEKRGTGGCDHSCMHVVSYASQNNIPTMNSYRRTLKHVTSSHSH